MRLGFAAPLALTLLLLGCSGVERVESLNEDGPMPFATISGPAGRIRGTVRFTGDRPSLQFDPILENQDVCGDQASLSRLELSDSGGVRNAFVYLESDELQSFPVEPPPTSADPILVDQQRCDYVPHALVVPAGSRVEVVNSDTILHNVHARHRVGAGLQTLFNIAQPISGQRTRVNSPLTDPGIVFLSCEAGHPWMSAYLFVTGHPYVTVTDENGWFTIENVPAGTYTIKMWHEGVRIDRIVRSLQRYDYEAPYELAMEVSVEADSETVVEFDMALRQENSIEAPGL